MKMKKFRKKGDKGVPRTDFRGGQNEEKISGGGQNPIFLPKNTTFFQKLIFFFLEKLVNQGGRGPPCPPWVRPWRQPYDTNGSFTHELDTLFFISSAYKAQFHFENKKGGRKSNLSWECLNVSFYTLVCKVTHLTTQICLQIQIWVLEWVILHTSA